MEPQSSHDISRQRFREHGIDAFRYICSFFVIFHHSLPDQVIPAPLWAAIAGSCENPVLPFYFMASGYFLHTPPRFEGNVIWKPIRRLLPVYVFWMVAYYVLLRLFPIRHAQFSIHDIAWGGVAYHLWFVPALAFGLAFVGTGLSVFGEWLTGVFCVVLTAVALAFGTYHDLLGLPGRPLLHNGQLAAPLDIFIGVMLAKRPPMKSWRRAAALVLATTALLVFEDVAIPALKSQPLTVGQVVVFSGFPAGAALLTLARALPETLWRDRLARLGRVALAIYAMHAFLIWVFLPVIGQNNLLDSIILAGLVFAVATWLSLSLQRVSILRPFVR